MIIHHRMNFLQADKYGGPQVHTKFKSLTLYSNHSRRIQIAHTKNQIFTPNSKTLAPNLNRSHRKSNLHTEFKSLTPNSRTLAPNLNRSHRKSNLHTEFKSLTPNSKTPAPNLNRSHRIQITHTELTLPVSGLAYLLRRYLIYSIYNVP